MQPQSQHEALDRHALVLAIWLAFGFAAFVLFAIGLGTDRVWFFAAGAVTVLAAFFGHVIANRLFGTTFTRSELALGLVVYGLSLLAFGIAVLFGDSYEQRTFFAICFTFVAVGATVVFCMILHFGLRRVFDAFDVVRDFGPSDVGGGR